MLSPDDKRVRTPLAREVADIAVGVFRDDQ